MQPPQWIPGHLELLTGRVEHLAPDGWVAVQVPSNLDAPSHRLMREAAGRHSRAEDLRAVLRDTTAVHEPAQYLAALAGAGLRADVWRTEYQHVLDPTGAHESPVLEWVRGTGLRPVLDVLTDEGERRRYLADCRAELDRAYPRHPWGVVFAMTRTFALGQRPR